MGEVKRENRFLVLKWDDIRKFLYPNDGEKLEEILAIIGEGRKSEGKKDNTYVVVNEDEPYAEKVWKLIQDHQETKEKELG